MLLTNEILVDERKTELSLLEESVINTLLYFDIFNHPLTADEIFFNLQDKFKKNELIFSITDLTDREILLHDRGFYQINWKKSFADRRLNGEKNTAEKRIVIEKYAGRISKFPFVKCICLSGSISKGYSDQKSDIDYFIITAPQRLWLARTLLTIYKKVFLFNSRKNFCINYFIAEDHLTIPDSNIFTATEVTHTIPVFNDDLYRGFRLANNWTEEYLPNAPLRKNLFNEKKKTFFLKNIFEKALKGNLGERLDKWCFQFTLKHWKKKFAHFDEESFDLNLRSRKNVSKHHPMGYQVRVLNAYSERKKLFAEYFFISLNEVA